MKPGGAEWLESVTSNTARSGGDDPVSTTLAEVLAAERRPTLVWGDRISPELFAVKGVKCFTDDAHTADMIGCHIGVVPEAASFERVALIMPRSKAALRFRVAQALNCLAPNGELLIAGHSRDGIKSAHKELGDAFGPSVVHRTKRHCRVIGANRLADAVAPPASIDSFVSQFTVGDEPALTVHALPGCFSQGRLDIGTQHLLRVLAAQKPGYKRAADLGSGAGVLGAWLARERPRATVELVDISATAAESSRRTLAANGLTGRVKLGEPSELDERAFDLVVSNPPRHDARYHDHSLTIAFAEAAYHRLAKNGRLFIVANHSSSLTKLLKARFNTVEVRYHDPSFRVWEAIKDRDRD